jgi:hypothetical protein
MYTYTINGTTYIQKPLVLGQIGQLTSLLQDISFSAFDPISIIAALSDRLPGALVVVLRKEGELLADKDYSAALRDIAETDLLQAVQIITDFFDCNPIQSLLESLNGISCALNQSMTGSASSSVSLPPEI